MSFVSPLLGDAVSSPPYMPLWVADYLVDTQQLSAAEHGAYLLLIMAYWQAGGPLPDNDDRLRRAARVDPADWPAIRLTMLEFSTAPKVCGGTLGLMRNCPGRGA